MRSVPLLLVAGLLLPPAVHAQRPVRAVAQPHAEVPGVVVMRGGGAVGIPALTQQQSLGAPPLQPADAAQVASLALTFGFSAKAVPFSLGVEHLSEAGHAYLRFWSPDVVSVSAPYTVFPNHVGPISAANPFKGVEVVMTPSAPGEQYFVDCHVWPASGFYTLRNMAAGSTQGSTGSASLHLVMYAPELEEVHVSITGSSPTGSWIFYGCDFTRVA